MVCYHLRLRFNPSFMTAFVGSNKLRKAVIASSKEKILRDKEGGKLSLDCAELVGMALALRMRARDIDRARFNIQREFFEKDPKFHEHIITIADTLRYNGGMGRILQFVRLRFTNHILAFVGNRKTTHHAEASSGEAALMDRVPKTNSIKAAELVGFKLAERMRAKQILRAKLSIRQEMEEKAPKYHSHIKAIAETLRKNGITLYD